MKIIGHRGAAGLALENTRSSIVAGINARVDAIEIDVRLTADDVFVLCHDTSLRRVGGNKKRISEQTLQEITSQQLHNGETPLSLADALYITRHTTLIIEAKGNTWATQLAKVIDSHKQQRIIVIALDTRELARFVKLSPDTETYLVQRFNPVDVLQALHDARLCGFTGVDMNFWLLNPLTYWLASRYGLAVIVYTVNWAWIAAFLRRMFPGVVITTDNPHIVS